MVIRRNMLIVGEKKKEIPIERKSIIAKLLYRLIINPYNVVCYYMYRLL
jgi:hypothetical protein